MWSLDLFSRFVFPGEAPSYTTPSHIPSLHRGHWFHITAWLRQCGCTEHCTVFEIVCGGGALKTTNKIKCMWRSYSNIFISILIVIWCIPQYTFCDFKPLRHLWLLIGLKMYWISTFKETIDHPSMCLIRSRWHFSDHIENTKQRLPSGLHKRPLQLPIGQLRVNI